MIRFGGRRVQSFWLGLLGGEFRKSIPLHCVLGLLRCQDFDLVLLQFSWPKPWWGKMGSEPSKTDKKVHLRDSSSREVRLTYKRRRDSSSREVMLTYKRRQRQQHEEPPPQAQASTQPETQQQQPPQAPERAKMMPQQQPQPQAPAQSERQPRLEPKHKAGDVPAQEV